MHNQNVIYLGIDKIVNNYLLNVKKSIWIGCVDAFWGILNIIERISNTQKMPEINLQRFL